MPFYAEWFLTTANLPKYCQTIRDLKSEYKGRLEIFLGLEIDFISGLMGPHSRQFDTLGLDYRIGSVHFVARFKDGTHWAVDSARDFARGFDEIYKGNIRQLVEDYYRFLREMIQTECPDIVGHLDVIKLNNGNDERYFSEKETWYRKAVRETLDIIAETDVMIEVNTGGRGKGKIEAFYPSNWILEECLERRIPITLNSDAHRPETVDFAFNEAAQNLIELGYRELKVLDENGWRSCPFSAGGVSW